MSKQSYFVLVFFCYPPCLPTLGPREKKRREGRTVGWVGGPRDTWQNFVILPPPVWSPVLPSPTAQLPHFFFSLSSVAVGPRRMHTNLWREKGKRERGSSPLSPTSSWLAAIIQFWREMPEMEERSERGTCGITLRLVSRRKQTRVCTYSTVLVQ